MKISNFKLGQFFHIQKRSLMDSDCHYKIKEKNSETNVIKLRNSDIFQ